MKKESGAVLVKDLEFQFVLKLFPLFIDTVKKRHGDSIKGI